MGYTTDQDSVSDQDILFDPLERYNANDSNEQNKKHKCTYPDCNSTFSRPSRLQRHIRSHTGERPYTCNYSGCTKSYTNSSHLKRHMETHNLTKKGYECTQCSMIISNLHNLKRHYKRMHSENKKLSCRECNMTFNKKHQLAEHEMIHFGPTIYKCDKCTKSFTNLVRFKRHHKTHEGIKTYSCPVSGCSEVFGKWLLLCAHKKTEHVTEFKCDKCDKVFFGKSRLKYHSKIHSENRIALQCPYDKCLKSYLFKYNLEQHIKIRHLGEKFYCDICSMGLTSKRKLIQHIQRHSEPTKKRKLSKIQRKKRKDTNIAKKSAISALIGINLPNNLEKLVMQRKTIISINE